MTKLEPPRRGNDFLIGFIPGLIVAILTGVLMFTIESFTPLFLAIGGLFIATIIAFTRHRSFIALGIITVLVATPLLLIGTCFAIVETNF